MKYFKNIVSKAISIYDDLLVNYFEVKISLKEIKNKNYLLSPSPKYENNFFLPDSYLFITYS